MINFPLGPVILYTGQKENTSPQRLICFRKVASDDGIIAPFRARLANLVSLVSLSGPKSVWSQQQEGGKGKERSIGIRDKVKL